MLTLKIFFFSKKVNLELFLQGKKFSEIYQEPEIKEVTVLISGFQICEQMYGVAEFTLEQSDGYLCVEIVDGSKLTKVNTSIDFREMI